MDAENQRAVWDLLWPWPWVLRESSGMGFWTVKGTLRREGAGGS